MKGISILIFVLFLLGLLVHLLLTQINYVKYLDFENVSKKNIDICVTCFGTNAIIENKSLFYECVSNGVIQLDRGYFNYCENDSFIIYIFDSSVSKTNIIDRLIKNEYLLKFTAKKNMNNLDKIVFNGYKIHAIQN